MGKVHFGYVIDSGIRDALDKIAAIERRTMKDQFEWMVVQAAKQYGIEVELSTDPIRAHRGRKTSAEA